MGPYYIKLYHQTTTDKKRVEGHYFGKVCTDKVIDEMPLQNTYQLINTLKQQDTIYICEMIESQFNSMCNVDSKDK